MTIKLNGGLGTSMGMDRAKSLLEVRQGLSFLDLTVRQTLALRRRFDVQCPLVLMNSFRTRAQSLQALDGSGIDVGLPLDFVQHRVPKIRARDLGLLEGPDDPSTWCPPGHGDIYLALVTSGVLDALIETDIRYAFVSNSDNLGATLDPALLQHFVQSGAPFMMEVADRTAADRKGGHLARSARDGSLLLRESAQCHPDEMGRFQDWRVHSYFNTNNLWVDLFALRQRLEQSGGFLDLPLIRNQKHQHPRDKSSEVVFQLETAMGAAIACFQGAQALRVPRTRFIPVKTTADLLRLRSDFYRVDELGRVSPVDSSVPPTLIDLDPAFYGHVPALQKRFPHGAPSLRACDELTLRGDVRFGRDVVLRGSVTVSNDQAEAIHIADGETLTGQGNR